MYLTVDKFRTMRYGNDLSDLEDIEIAEKIAEASALVDGYCSIPTIPQRHDFRGGSITDEEHAWRIPQMFEPPTRRAYPFHWPLRVDVDNEGRRIPRINYFGIWVTNTQRVTIQPTDLFVQNSERYVEVVSLALTSSGLFNALIIPNVGLATPTLRMSYEYGYIFSSDPNEQLYASDALVYRGRNQWWSTEAAHAPEVKRAGTVVEPTDYTVDYDEGTITFNAPIAGDEASAADRVTCTYKYRLPTEITRATGLITSFLLGEADLVASGMAGLTVLSVAEVRMQRGRAAGTLTVDQLDALVPAATYLLTGFKQWRAAA